MRTERPTHTVLVTSRTEGNPYDVGREYDLNAVLYCQGVFDNDGRAGGRGRDPRPGLGGERGSGRAGCASTSAIP